jgi:DNA-binding NarL/FixJ family response regulator
MKQVLLLEENPLFREGLALLLEWSLGLDPLRAGAGKEAGGAWPPPRDRFELAIVNVDSRDGDPLGLIEEIRGVDPDVPVLALTASRSLEGRAPALRAGANDVFLFYLRAPIEELVESVRWLVGATQTPTAPVIRSLLRYHA